MSPQARLQLEYLARKWKVHKSHILAEGLRRLYEAEQQGEPCPFGEMVPAPSKTHAYRR